jgi:hypothetical protein
MEASGCRKSTALQDRLRFPGPHIPRLRRASKHQRRFIHNELR